MDEASVTIQHSTAGDFKNASSLFMQRHEKEEGHERGHERGKRRQSRGKGLSLSERVYDKALSLHIVKGLANL
jgi:hypothetical protein